MNPIEVAATACAECDVWFDPLDDEEEGFGSSSAPAIFPNMKHIQNVAWGSKRSGIIILGGK